MVKCHETDIIDCLKYFFSHHNEGVLSISAGLRFSIVTTTTYQQILPCLYYIPVGRGVFATKPIEPGDFVLEYRGKLLRQEEWRSKSYLQIESTFL